VVTDWHSAMMLLDARRVKRRAARTVAAEARSVCRARFRGGAEMAGSRP
jgi:hypothetical protein